MNFVCTARKKGTKFGINDRYFLVRTCVCVWKSMGVCAWAILWRCFFVEVHTEVESKCVCMGRYSYAVRVKVDTCEMTCHGGWSRGDVFF